MKSYKTVTEHGTPEDLVTMAINDLEEIATEVGEWRDGMSGTNLENSEKYQLLDGAYEQLTNIQEPTPDEWPHAEAAVTYTYMTPKRKMRSPSRSVRVSNACGIVGSVADFYESLDDAEEHTDLIEELREIADMEVQLPGMYG